MKALMLAFTYTLPYHVMRSAAQAGHKVHTLGAGNSRGVRWSRYSAGFRPLEFDYRSENYDQALDQIHRECTRVGADIILPSDDVSTRLLIALRDRLPVPTSALPSLESFDKLNDKWNFAQLATAHETRIPRTWLYQGPSDIDADLRAGKLDLPLTLKPANLSGMAGVRHLHTLSDRAVLDIIDYRPIVVQRFIAGTELGVSVLCREGEVVAHVVQQRGPGYFKLIENPDLLANVKRAVRAAKLHGPANFDAMVAEDDGLGYILECNPRFWYTIFITMVLGLNFVDMAMRLDADAAQADRTRSGIEVRINRDLFLSPLRPWTNTAQDWRMLAYHVTDPIAIACDRWDVFLGQPVGVRREMMSAYVPVEPAAEAAE